MRVAVIGAGSWGTTLSIVAARAGHSVRLWSRNREVVEEINRQRHNRAYLGSEMVPHGVRATADVSEALDDAELVVLALPSHATREWLMRAAPGLSREPIFVSATKGIESETGMRISEILRDVISERFIPRFVCLSGPSFAREVVAGHPTAVVAASRDDGDARRVQAALSFGNLRIYTNDDVVGTEIGGAVKNVMAIAAGIVAGLGLGTNSIAALITRGLAEITRLAVAQGARAETLMGLAGLGDLVLTCTGALSRNRYVGQELGRGRTLADITSGMREVAEGIRTTRAVKQLAARLGVEMPIASEVYAVLYEGKSPRRAADELMARPLRGEKDSG
jgi:glycerol-3-phosphate dehydrogenase (NAD(P)+)